MLGFSGFLVIGNPTLIMRENDGCPLLVFRINHWLVLRQDHRNNPSLRHIVGSFHGVFEAQNFSRSSHSYGLMQSFGNLVSVLYERNR